MLKSQKIELRRSEIRQRLNEISGLEGEAFTDAIKAESAELEREFSGLDTQYRAALIAEGGDGETTTETTETESREAAELRTLTDGVMLGSYLSTALGGGSLEGRERELNSHIGLDDSVIPFAAIAPRVEQRAEHRADAITPAPATTGVASQSIIERVFASTAAAFLNVDLPTVGVGVANFPVLTSGAAGSTVDKDAAVDAQAATFTPNTLNPTRLQASYLFRREDRAILAGMEDALRADLSGALGEALDKVIIAGQAANPTIPGFLGTGLAAPNPLPAVVADFAAYVSSTAGPNRRTICEQRRRREVACRAEHDQPYALAISGGQRRVGCIVSCQTFWRASRFRARSSQDECQCAGRCCRAWFPACSRRACMGGRCAHSRRSHESGQGATQVDRCDACTRLRLSGPRSLPESHSSLLNRPERVQSWSTAFRVSSVGPRDAG